MEKVKRSAKIHLGFASSKFWMFPNLQMEFQKVFFVLNIEIFYFSRLNINQANRQICLKARRIIQFNLTYLYFIILIFLNIKSFLSKLLQNLQKHKFWWLWKRFEYDDVNGIKKFSLEILGGDEQKFFSIDPGNELGKWAPMEK